jgi:hypothetical protein
MIQLEAVLLVMGCLSSSLACGAQPIQQRVIVTTGGVAHAFDVLCISKNAQDPPTIRIGGDTKPSGLVELVLQPGEECENVSASSETDVDGDGISDITVNPGAMGAAARLEFFLVKKFARVQYAGSLPMAADPDGRPGSFRVTETQGGSVFSRRMAFQDGRLVTTDELELMLEGSICVGPNREVVGNNGRPCKSRVSASKRHPICISHLKAIGTIAPDDACKSLLSGP